MQNLALGSKMKYVTKQAEGQKMNFEHRTSNIE